MPKMVMQLLEEGSLVIVKDVSEDEDEDEDDGDEAAPMTVARASSPLLAPHMLGSIAASTSLCTDVGVEMGAISTGRSSSLLPLATPFFPTKQSTGRSKALRWMKDSGDFDFV